MPRVHVPNSRLAARADCPLLPFLAPRAFTESPIRRYTHHAPSKEKEEALAGRDTVVPAPYRTPSHNTRWRQAFLLYADISSFARQQLRTFSTATSAGAVQSKSRNTHPKNSTSKRAQRAHRGPNTRRDALALEQDRLSKYLSHLPSSISASELHKSGQYRSLCRRIANLQHWDSTRLDLSMHNANAVSHAGLIQAFAALDRIAFPSVTRHTQKMTLEHDPHCISLIARLFHHQADWIQTSDRWMELDVEERGKWYQRLLLYLLDREPVRALDFLRVLANDTLLRDSSVGIIADALEHLSNIHRRELYDNTRGWGDDPKANSRSFVPAFVHIFQAALIEHNDVCSQELLYSLIDLDQAQGNDLIKVTRCLVAAPTRLSFDTLLHYANAFGERGDSENALRCLTQLKVRLKMSWGSVVDRQRLRWTCALILRKSMSKGQDFHETLGLVASFVKLGIRMDINLYNVVMHNAMEAGDFATAFKVYNTLESNGLKPDLHTLSILLQGCTMQSSPETFQDFAQYCEEKALELKDPYLATDCLYYHYTLRQNDSKLPQAASSLWQKYVKLFSAEALQPLVQKGRRREFLDKQSSEPGSKFEPPPMAVFIMLRMEIRLAQAVSMSQVLKLYQQFRDLAKTPAMSELAQKPVIWNAFLLAFCQKQQFADASQVVKDMSDGSSRPNVYTWNIFMQAFCKMGQMQAANRVFDIMRGRGTEPDQYTYGVLLRGFARAQLVDRIGETMQHVSAEQELDPGLLRVLAKVTDRENLMRTLKKSRTLREIKAKEKAKQLAEDESIRWDPLQLQQKEWQTPISKVQDTDVLIVSQGSTNATEKPTSVDEEMPSLVHQSAIAVNG